MPRNANRRVPAAARGASLPPLRPLLRASVPSPEDEHATSRQPGARRRTGAALRAARAVALYVEGGLTYAEIGRELGLSCQRVHQIIGVALKEAAERRRDLAEFALERALAVIDAIMREAWEILLRKCDQCGGDEKRRAQCWACERTGYFYRVEDRFAAFDRYARGQDRRIKLLGLEGTVRAQPAASPSRDFYAELQALSDEELDAELERLTEQGKDTDITPESDEPS